MSRDDDSASIEQILSAQLDLMSEQLDLYAGAAGTAGTALPAAATPVPRPLREDKRFPLTEAQTEVWLATRLGADASRAFHENMIVRLRGRLDPAACGRAFQRLVDRHEALRSSFRADGETQDVSADLGVEVPVKDVSGDLDDRLDRAIATPFDTARGPLVRARLLRESDTSHVLLVCAHHLVCDGWSSGVLMEELGKLYHAEVTRTDAGLSPPMQISEYAAWQRERRSGPEAAANEAYWLERFADPPPVLELPIDRPRPARMTFRGRTLRREIASETYARIKKFGAQHKCTLSTTLLASYFFWLHRLSGQDDVVVGISVSGQTLAGGDGLVGHCVNMLPLRGRIDLARPFSAYLEEINRQVLDSQEHQEYTFGSLIRKLKLPRDPSRTPLVQAEYTLEPAATGLAFSDLETEVLPDPNRFYNKDVFFNFVVSPRSLTLLCEYNSDLFETPTMERYLGAFEHLLDEIVAHPDREAGALSLLDEASRRRLAELNETEKALALETTVDRAIAEVAGRRRDKTAVVCGEDRLTYRELDERANRLAHHLIAEGVAPEERVAVCLERGTELVVALLGVLRAGAAYVPVDPGYPARRVAFMLEDSGARRLITQQRLVPSLPDVPVVRIDAEWGRIAGSPADPPPPRAAPGNLAYVIFTSGSTGKPKGVQIPHRALANFLGSMEIAPGLAPDDRLLAVTTPSFDIAGLEIYLPLLCGAELHIATREETMDGKALARRIEESEITAMQATPATWQLLVASGWGGSSRLRIWSGGEALSGDLAGALLERGAEVWNLYGPTETTVWSAVDRVAELEPVQPLGRPIHNTTLHVLDERLAPVPLGVEGDLFIGGEGVARGYLGRPRLTAERFVPDPFSATPGARMYRTGDRARYRSDGALRFVGREDHQVKVRGFRIETGEIDAVLTGLSGVREAVTIVREDEPGDRRLVAYILADGAPPESAALRAGLRESLPDYMVPHAFVALESYPLTPNGKVDRAALPAPAAAREDREDVAERSSSVTLTPTEARVRTIWTDVLGTEDVGCDDNFFDLGGHSLLAVRVLARLEEETGLALPPTELMFQSLGELAAAIDEKTGVSTEPPTAPAVPVEREQPDAATDAGDYAEEIVAFGPGGCLAGILTRPAREGSGLGAVFVNHGMLHRVGPNRLHVKVARALARAGHAVLRFDFSGMGDSRVRPDKLPFERRAVVEAQEAMRCLRERTGVERFVLGGICSGAISSYNAAKADPAVRGLVMINPQFFDEELASFVEGRRGAYWKRVLTSPQRWREFLTGKAEYGMIGLRLRGLLMRKSKADDLSGGIAGELAALNRRGTRLLLVYSALDWGLEYLHMILQNANEDLTRSGGLVIEQVPRSDHVFTPLAAQTRLVDAIARFCEDQARVSSEPPKK